MRELLKKFKLGLYSAYDFPAVAIFKNGVLYFNFKAKDLLGIEKGDKVILSKNNELISIAMDSRIDPVKYSYNIQVFDKGTYTSSRHLSGYEIGWYKLPEKPSEFDGKYEWFDLEKISE